jgi:diguanylate cyclase
VTLHFLAMGAMQITPIALDPKPLDAEGHRGLALATTLLGGMVIAAGVFAALMEKVRAEAARELTRMALRDPLTGLANRAAFQAELTRRVTDAEQTRGGFAVLAIDLDRFKQVNDLHGHKGGDEVLVQIGQRIAATIDARDVAARIGGDEFIVLAERSDPTALHALACQLQAALQAPIALDGCGIGVGGSIGVACFPIDGGDAATLMVSADLAMYRAKIEPGPCYYDASRDHATRDRRGLADELRMALQHGEIAVRYQRQFCIRTGRVTGFHAVPAWRHATRGEIAPALFVALAEETGTGTALARTILRTACSDAARWVHALPLTIGATGLQLSHGELPRMIEAVLIETGLPAERLTVEAPESALLADRERTVQALTRIAAQGVGVALGAFGGASSSLDTLRAFAFARVHLDRALTASLGQAPDVAILRAVLVLCRNLAVPVAASGVETREQLAFLAAEGCDEAEGALFGAPSTAAPDTPFAIKTPVHPVQRVGKRA